MKRLIVVLTTIWLLLGVEAQQQATVNAHPSTNAQPSNLAYRHAADSLASTHHAQLSFDAFFLEAMVQRQWGRSAAAFDLLQYCIKLDPQAAEAYYFLAQYYQQMKNDSTALQCYQKAVELEPDNITFMERLAMVYIEQRNYSSAIDVVERLYAQDKSREDYLEMLENLYGATGNFDKVIETLDRRETIEGKSENLSFNKSSIYTQQGKKQAAIDEMETLARQYPNDLNCKGKLADVLLINDEEQRALQLYDEILQEEPNNTHALSSLRSYYKVQGETEMVDSLTERLLLNPGSSTEQRVHLIREMVTSSEQADGDSTQVLAMFHKILALPQQDADIAQLCAAYMDLKKMPRDSIRTMLQTVLDIAPDNAAARLQLVSFAWDRRDHDQVISLCQEARQYNPEEMAFYYYQGMAYFQQDNHDKALEAFQNGIGVITPESNPAIVSDFYAIMGDLLHQKGMARQAFEAYDSCLQWKADNIMCMNNYAYYLSELGQQLDKAEQMSYKTIKAEPKSATYLDTYAWILYMQERYAEAKIYIDQALQNDSDSSAVITEHAGDIYYHCGNTARAVELWQQALLKDPRNKILIRKVKRRKYVKK